jgi:uncharacterized metal-binding protein
MPSGRTHDQITLGVLPFVAVSTLFLSRSASITLSLSGAFLFSGLMFGPDLDIYSVQYQRWGWLKVIWLPYRRMFRHRSCLSHGLFIGTLLRLVYLGVWLGMGIVVIILTAWILDQGWGISLDWQAQLQPLQQQVSRYQQEGLALLLGLELGAMSHTLSDGLGSVLKSTRKRLRN